MMSTDKARSAARSARLAAAREYATEVVQHAELQENLGLEDKILGNLSGIIVEAIDCVRSDQPFRSSSLSMLSLELLSYLRQQNKPMLVNFACAFTMLMSELEGIDLTERQEGCTRSYSNSIPDVPPEAAPTVATTSGTAPSSASRIARHPQPLPPPPPPPQDLFGGLLKEELFQNEPEEQKLDESIDYDELDRSEKAGSHSMEGDLRDDGRSESSYIDDANGQSDLLQRMIANFSTPSTSSSFLDASTRSEAAKNQPKSKSGRFESKDAELAATFALPVSATEIENLPDHDMARLLRSAELTEEQRTIMRQIRKRARSKISSREYRRRKEAKRLGEAMNTSSQGSANN